MKKMISILPMMVLLATCFSCYRIPSDDDYSLVPVTNNPDNTGDTGATPGMPTLGY